MNKHIVCTFIQTYKMMRFLHTIFFFVIALVIYADSKPLEVIKGINDLEKVILTQTQGSSVEVYLYGALVTSWKNNQGEELLLVSSKATFTPPKAIRGGIPVMFPQYANLGPLPSHGFARNRFWTIDNNPSPDIPQVPNGVCVDFVLKATEEDLKLWPHRFEFRSRVTLTPGGDLILASCIRNIDAAGKPFTFTFGHHPYFSVSDISKVEVKGMAKLDYLDQIENRTRHTENKDTITFNSRFDRIYLSTPNTIEILDHEKKRTFVVQKDGFPDTVVWNPGEEKAKTIVDLGEGEYRHFVAVEPVVAEKPVTLNPGEKWNTRMELSTRR